MAAIAAAALFAAPLSTARANPSEDRATARELALEGIAAEEKGDFATAIDRLEKAEGLFHAPTHLQHIARCLAKSGRLVEATEVWRKLAMEHLDDAAPDAFKAAVDEAKDELPKIEPRLAHLIVTVGASYPELAVTLDDKPYPSAAFNVSRVVDPGAHTLRATAPGYAPMEQPVQLAEGGTGSIAIDLAPTSKPPAPVPWKTIGVVTASVGGAMLVVGVIEALSAKSKFDSLQSSCQNHVCPAGYDLEGQKSSVRSSSTLANVFLIGGGVLVVAGAGVYLLAPTRPAGDSISVDVAPTYGGASFSLSGKF